MAKVFRTELFTGNEEYHKIIHNLNSSNYLVAIKDKDGDYIRGAANYIDNNTIVIVVPKNKRLEITVAV